LFHILSLSITVVRSKAKLGKNFLPDEKSLMPEGLPGRMRLRLRDVRTVNEKRKLICPLAVKVPLCFNGTTSMDFAFVLEFFGHMWRRCGTATPRVNEGLTAVAMNGTYARNSTQMLTQIQIQMTISRIIMGMLLMTKKTMAAWPAFLDPKLPLVPLLIPVQVLCL